MKYQSNADERLVAMVKSDEGFEPRYYTDTEGFLTIGIGFCLDKTQMPEKVSDYWCGYILDGLHQRLKENPSVGQTYTDMDKVRKWAICNMCYQMGLTGVCSFLNMWAALDDRDYKAAADHALDSLWAHQTPNRAKRVAAVIRTGNLDSYQGKKKKDTTGKKEKTGPRSYDNLSGNW